MEDLDDATCFAYTLAFLSHLQSLHRLKPGSKIWVGHDRRPSSPRIAAACIAAIRHAGHAAHFCGEIATPALAFAALEHAEPAVMITGSHIPFDRNGIKFHRADGEMMKEDEQPIISCKVPFPSDAFDDAALRHHVRLPEPDQTAHNLYAVRYLTGFPDLLKDKTIGHYQHSAAGRDALAALLEELGATVVPLGRSEEFVPIDTEAVSDADTRQAQQWCKQHNLDAVISTDGDGDRPLLSDETGTYFRGDTLGILAGMALSATTMVTPVSSNSAMEKSTAFRNCIRTRIGSPHVIAAMNTALADQSARVAGFEANGGFLTATPLTSPANDTALSPLPTRDAVLPVLAAFALMKVKGFDHLSKLHTLLPRRFTASDRVENTPKEKSVALIETFRSDPANCRKLHLQNVTFQYADETDGLRITFANSDIIHLRPSGNAPELRIYVESDGKKASAALLDHARSVILGLL